MRFERWNPATHPPEFAEPDATAIAVCAWDVARMAVPLRDVEGLRLVADGIDQTLDLYYSTPQGALVVELARLGAPFLDAFALADAHPFVDVRGVQPWEMFSVLAYIKIEQAMSNLKGGNRSRFEQCLLLEAQWSANHGHSLLIQGW